MLVQVSECRHATGPNSLHDTAESSQLTIVPTEEDTMSVGEDNGQVFEAEGGAAGAGTDEPPPEGEIEAEQPFNPIPLKELVQTPNKEDLFGKSARGCWSTEVK